MVALLKAAAALCRLLVHECSLEPRPPLQRQDQLEQIPMGRKLYSVSENGGRLGDSVGGGETSSCEDVSWSFDASELGILHSQQQKDINAALASGTDVPDSPRASQKLCNDHIDGAETGAETGADVQSLPPHIMRPLVVWVRLRLLPGLVEMLLLPPPSNRQWASSLLPLADFSTSELVQVWNHVVKVWHQPVAKRAPNGVVSILTICLTYV